MLRSTKYVKVAIIGDSGVGKTSIIKSYFGEDIKNVKSTLAIDIYNITKRELNIVLWDFAGQRWFVDILVNFIKGANIIILVFDLSDLNSLKNIITYWIAQIRKYKDKDSIVVIVGNKKDKKRVDDTILAKILDKIKETLDYHIFIQTSALRGENIQKLFNIIVDLVESFILSKKTSRPH